MKSLSLLMRLSFRNLLRHRRRNLLMVSAITVAVSTVVLLGTLIRGMQQDMANSAVENLTGHLKVYAPGYLDDPNIEKSFPLPENLGAAGFGLDASNQATVMGWAARIQVPAVIMSERETRGIQLVGIDPAQENISFLADVTYQGKGLSSVSDRHVIIGKALAEQLETDVGRRLVLISQGLDGANREAGFRIAGIFDADGTGLEKAYVFTGRERLQELLDADVVTEVSVRLNREPETWSIQGLVADYFGGGLDVENWQQLNPQAAQFYVLADVGIYVYFAIMMGALAFGLINTLVTAVMERIKELGLLRALGMRPTSVVIQVVLESSLLMLVGVVAGTLIGAGFAFWLRDGIDLSAFAESGELLGMSSRLTPQLFTSDVVGIGIASIILGIVASLYPAIRAVKIKPLEALGR